MDLQTLLQQLLNPNGTQQAQPMPQMAPQQVGDHGAPFMPQSRLAAPPQAPQRASVPQAPQGQPMQQNAPQATADAGYGTGGGIGGLLQSVFAPRAAQKNATVQWLQSQGYDQGTATILASDKGALRQVIMNRGQRDKPIEINGRLVDPTDYHVLADFSTPPAPAAREIRNDANGVPRYTDNGLAVYPSDQSASGGTQFFSGRSVEAQGLNYLIDQKVLSKEQAANVAAGKQVTGPNGEIIFMTPQGIFQQPPGGAATPVQPGGAPQQNAPSGNIPITGPKYSEDMRKAGGFALRAQEADKIVSDPKISEAGASFGQKLKNDVPVIGNYLTSSDFQQYDQAQRDFVNAVLRRESGAAISESEFQNARKQYFPQPGDEPRVIEQKAANRKLAVQSLHQSADPVPSMSPGYSPGDPAATTPAGQRVIKQMTNPSPMGGEWREVSPGVRIRKVN